MRRKQWAALAGAILLCAGLFAGCKNNAQEAAAPEPTVSMRNDGREARIVLGALKADGGRVQVLQEIVEKYRADFPHTEVEIRSYSNEEELEADLRAGRLDIAEVRSENQAAYVEDGLLTDIYPYLKAWSESATLTPAAKQAAGSLGEGRAYLLLNDFTQDMLYYRADWFDEYNEGLEKGQAVCRSWGQIAGEERNGEMVLGAAQKLGDRGRLAFAGKDKLVDYFDAMVWSAINMGRIADSGAAYFSAADETRSIFSLEKAAEGASEFWRVMTEAALPEALDWTQEQAIEAFLDGRAGLLLADRSVMGQIGAALPAESWTMAAFPLGRAGTAIFAGSFTGWGVSAKVSDLEITAHFLTYLSNADNNTHYAKVCGVLPIHLTAGDMELSLSEGNLAAEMNMISRGSMYRYASEPVMYKAYQGYRQQANEKLRQYAGGELSQGELLGWLDDYWSAACKDEGKRWK